MGLGVIVWVILIIVLFGGFDAIAIIAVVSVIAFVIGLLLSINDKDERSKK